MKKILCICAHFAREKISKDKGLKSSIRIWPYHFDTGVYGKLSGTEISVGLSLAIPDSICNEHYICVNGYNS